MLLIHLWYTFHCIFWCIFATDAFHSGCISKSILHCILWENNALYTVWCTVVLQVVDGSLGGLKFRAPFAAADNHPMHCTLQSNFVQFIHYTTIIWTIKDSYASCHALHRASNLPKLHLGNFKFSSHYLQCMYIDTIIYIEYIS